MGGSAGAGGLSNLLGGGGQSFDPTTGAPFGPGNTGDPSGAFWGNPSNPAVLEQAPEQAAQNIQSGSYDSTTGQPTASPTGQQSGPSTPSWVQNLSSIFLGGGAPSSQPISGPGGQSANAGTIGWPTTTPAPGSASATLPAGSAGAALPANPQTGIANTPSGLAGASPTALGIGTGVMPLAASILPQFAPVSGKTQAAPDAGAPPAGPTEAAPAAAPTPDTTNYPDVAGSAREAGAGSPATTQTANNPFTAAGTGIPPALQDLFSLNFGRFISDLLGQQGISASQNQAAAPRPRENVLQAAAEAIKPKQSPADETPTEASVPPTPAQAPGEAAAAPQAPTASSSETPAANAPAATPEAGGGNLTGTTFFNPRTEQQRPTTAAAPPQAAPVPTAAAPGAAGAALPPAGTPAPGAQTSPSPIGGITQYGGVPALTANDVQIGGVHRPTMRPAQPSVDRSSFQNEVQANRGSLPDGSATSLMEQAAWMVNGEVMSNASVQARRTQLETAFNRAQMRGQSLANTLRPSLRKGDGGYYDGLRGLHAGTYRWGARPTPTQLAQFKRDVWDPVVAGSNYSDVGWGPMTGNASAGVARNQYAKGTPGYRIRQGGDTYFLEGPVRRLPAVSAPTAATVPPAGGAEGVPSREGIDPRYGRTGVVGG